MAQPTNPAGANPGAGNDALANAFDIAIQEANQTLFTFTVGNAILQPLRQIPR